MRNKPRRPSCRIRKMMWWIRIREDHSPVTNTTVDCWESKRRRRRRPCMGVRDRRRRHSTMPPVDRRSIKNRSCCKRPIPPPCCTINCHCDNSNHTMRPWPKWTTCCPNRWPMNNPSLAHVGIPFKPPLPLLLPHPGKWPSYRTMRRVVAVVLPRVHLPPPPVVARVPPMHHFPLPNCDWMVPPRLPPRKPRRSPPLPTTTIHPPTTIIIIRPSRVYSIPTRIRSRV